MTESERIRSAVRFIPSDDRAIWVEVGMAIHAGMGSAGADLWHEWSRTSDRYNETAARAVWRSFRGGGITTASLFRRAIDGGWAPDAEYKPPSPEEIARQRAESARLMRLEQERRERGYAEAANRAREMLGASVTGTHGYLAEKGFPAAVGFIHHQSSLLIPMRSLAGDLWGVQSIRVSEDRQEWIKKFQFGARTKGAACRLGPQAQETCIVEGYATGLSVLEAIRMLRLRVAVVVAFSAHNLTHVAGLIPGRKWAFADHDESGSGERAAQAAGIQYCMADQLGWDANDLYQKAGVMAVASKILEARKRL